MRSEEATDWWTVTWYWGWMWRRWCAFGRSRNPVQNHWYHIIDVRCEGDVRSEEASTPFISSKLGWMPGQANQVRRPGEMVMSGGSGQEAKIHQNPCFLFQNIRGPYVWDPMFGHSPPEGQNPSKSMFSDPKHKGGPYVWAWSARWPQSIKIHVLRLLPLV